MADKIVNLHIDPSTQLPIPERFVDNGDGTWSLKVNSAGGGGGGGPATIADGADVAQGATTDVAVTGDAAGTLSAKLRGLLKAFPTALGGNGGLKVEGVAGGVAQPVSGTFFQATQPISAADGQDVAQGALADAGVFDASGTVNAHVRAVAKALGDNSGAAVITDVNGTIQQYARGLVKLIAAKIGVTIASGDDVAEGAIGDAAWVSGNGTVIGLLKNIATKLAGSVAVTGTFWQATQPVSAADGSLTNIGAAANTASSTTVMGYLLKLIALFPTTLNANGQGQLGVVLNGKRTTQTSYNNSVATPITAANVLGTAATPTVAAVTEAGSTLANVAYFTAVSAGKNGMGNSPVSGLSTTLTPTANQAIRMTVTQVANADYYDLFLSTSSTAPLWVGRVTEAQRLAGNSIISTVGVVTGNAHNVANTVDIGIVGTGQATSQPNFSFNNGYLLSSLPVINCVGYDWLHIWLKLVLDDLRTAPVVNLMPFFQSDLTSTDWFSGDIFQSAIGRAEGYTFNQLVSLEVSGHDAVILAVSTLTGQITGSNGLSISYQLS